MLFARMIFEMYGRKQNMEKLHQFTSRHNPTIKVYKRQGTEVLWLNRSISEYAQLNHDDFLDRFSFTTTHPDQICSKLVSCIARAERYGGGGIGVHGGGARAAIINSAVVKGVGCNQLAGVGGDKLHSSGGLHIYYAVKEVVLSNLLSNLLPLGVGSIHGLIHLDSEGEEYEGNRCASVLLIREQCLRLGNFLAPRNFRPQCERIRPVVLAQQAIRDIHLELEATVGTRNLVLMLGSCLQKHARQFAFSRFSLLAHNAISESNLCFDGRWIDLPIAGFVNSGKNFLQASSFYSEYKIIINFIAEFSYTYSKYTKKYFNPQALVNYYLDQFNAYQRVYAGYYFGFSDRIMAVAAEISEWNEIYKSMLDIIVKKSEYEVCLPAYSASDELILCIQNLYLGLANCIAISEQRKSGHEEQNKKSFSIVFDKIFKEFGESSPKANVIKFLYIKAMQRFFYKQFFHSDTLSNEIFNICRNIKDVNSYINNMSCISLFIGNYTSLKSICIYEMRNTRIEYCTENGGFRVWVSNSEYFEKYSKNLYKYIHNATDANEVSSNENRQKAFVEMISEKLTVMNLEL